MRPLLTSRRSTWPLASDAGWRTRLRPALPLFVIAAVSFGVSLLLFRSVSEGPGHLPIWTLFSATGVILAMGGTAVVVAGGDESVEPTPFYDTDRFVLLPKEEYERLRSPLTAASSSFEATSASPLPEAPIVPEGAMGPTTPPAAEWSEEPTAPPEHIRTTSELELALNEVESVLASLASPAESATGSRSAEVSPLRRPVPPAERTTPSESPTNSLPPGGVGSPTHQTVVPPAASRGICTSCGMRIPNASKAVRCHACDEPLCVACAARADWEGHADLCPRCHGLLVLSRDAEDAP